MIILYSQQWQIDNKLHKIDMHRVYGKSATAHNAECIAWFIEILQVLLTYRYLI